jgi:striatin 1/3/4
MSEKYTLKSHMDSVRSAHFMPGGEVLATVSEDCMVKLWSLESIESKYTKSNGNVEPYLTLRGHTGPLLAVAGLNDAQRKNANLLFTAGDEGCIRVWDVPSISDVH